MGCVISTFSLTTKSLRDVWFPPLPFLRFWAFLAWSMVRIVVILDPPLSIRRAEQISAFALRLFGVSAQFLILQNDVGVHRQYRFHRYLRSSNRAHLQLGVVRVRKPVLDKYPTRHET